MRTHARTAEDTEDLGRRLARARPAADAALAVLYLTGELGAGKTTFARGFLRALGVADAVPSPTYTLLELYPVGALTVVHVDLYRVRDAGELESLGLRDWARSGHVWLVEWPERGGIGKRFGKKRSSALSECDAVHPGILSSGHHDNWRSRCHMME